MAQLVYVHGVNNRKENPGFEAGQQKRKRMLEQHSFRGNAVHIREPYWGEFGAKPKFDLACVPGDDDGVQLGGLGAGLAATPPPSDDPWLVSAKESFQAVAHTLSQGAADAGHEKLTEAIVLYALHLRKTTDDGQPGWLNDVADDDAFLARLEQEARAFFQAETGDTTLSIGDHLRGIGRSIIGGASNLVNGPIAGKVREFTPHIARFIGDVFKYLQSRAPREQIRNAIHTDLVAAAQDVHGTDEPLILIGHSLGGVILYDMLSDPEYRDRLQTELGFPLSVDLFVTLGSQPGLFEELDLFVSSEAGEKNARPPGVARWWNIYDRVDVLSFAAEGSFDDVVDLEADTVASVATAHGAYLDSHYVHGRLHERLKEEGLIH